MWIATTRAQHWRAGRRFTCYNSVTALAALRHRVTMIKLVFSDSGCAAGRIVKATCAPSRSCASPSVKIPSAANEGRYVKSTQGRHIFEQGLMRRTLIGATAAALVPSTARTQAMKEPADPGAHAVGQDLNPWDVLGWEPNSRSIAWFEMNGLRLRIPRKFIYEVFDSPLYSEDEKSIVGRLYTPTLVAVLPNLESVPIDLQPAYRVLDVLKNPDMIVIYPSPETRRRREKFLEWIPQLTRQPNGRMELHKFGLNAGLGFDGNLVVWGDSSLTGYRAQRYIENNITIVYDFNEPYARDFYALDEKVTTLVRSFVESK